MRFATQCLLTIIGILRQVFVSSRYRWKKDIVELCAKPQKRHKSNKLTYSQRFQYCPQNFGRPSLVPPLFEIQNRHWVEAVLFLWKRKRKRENYIASASNIGYLQGRSQTFSFGEATRGASFATRGAVMGLCRTFRKRPIFWGARQNFGRAVDPLAHPQLRPWLFALKSNLPKHFCPFSDGD